MTDQEKTKIPNHVGLIIDGNRRWAKERHLPVLEGYSKGYEKLKLISDELFSRGVKIISVYAFSTENWDRPQEEVNFLMKLLSRAIKEETERVCKKNYKVLISGRIDDLPGDLPDACNEIMTKTKTGKAGTLNICINYGGRAEIVDAIKKMIKNKIDPEQVHEGMIKKYLYQSELTDPDIIVRTSGEKRLSGFQLWESAYSELMFLDKYWPDIEEIDADKIIEEYLKRNRRFGGNDV